VVVEFRIESWPQVVFQHFQKRHPSSAEFVQQFGVGIPGPRLEVMSKRFYRKSVRVYVPLPAKELRRSVL
jgi:hypothetical protein